jgi:transglutaminase-like putative cysteine protease
MIDLYPEAPDLQAYLECTEVVNFTHPLVVEWCAQFMTVGLPEVELVERIYTFVRDQIAHSGDIHATAVTCHAAEVLQARHGICCAKAYLLAALLRSVGIPTGFCYQKLRADDEPDAPFVIHGLNAVYLSAIGRWIRLDARGNKPGVNAAFRLDEEQIAWPINQERGERDDPVVYAQPWPAVVKALQSSATRAELYPRWLALFTPDIEAKFA